MGVSDEHAGRVLGGKYRLRELLATGGMGLVYAARHLATGREVAVKVLRSELLGSHEVERRIQREARLAVEARHPNVVEVLDAGADPFGTPYLVLERLYGETFDVHLVEPLELLPVSQVLVPILNAVSHLHAIGIVHRDIKPANVFLSVASDGRVTPKLLDFGVAKALEQSDLTRAGVQLGTPAYMAPEQATGLGPIGPAADVWAMGIVFARALGQTRISADVAAVLERATQPELAERYPSSRQFRDELLLALQRVSMAVAWPGTTTSSYHPSELGLRLRFTQAAPEASPAPATDEHVPGSVTRTLLGARTLVGRERELAQLSQLLQRAIQGSGRIVFITARAGMGKTALAEQFMIARRRGSDEPVLMATGRCLEQYGKGEAYLPFLDAVGNLLSGPYGAAVARVLRKHAPTWCVQLPAFFGVHAEHESLERDAFGATRARMLREMGEALDALSACMPLVLLLEDLHWADPSSSDLLRSIGQRCMKSRLLVVGTLRPEADEQALRNVRRELLAHDQCEEISLPLLSEGNIRSYLDARFEDHAFPFELATLIVKQTEGQPLFATRLLQLLVERGDIAAGSTPGGSARWRLMRPLAELQRLVPDSVRGVIQRKLESLNAEDLRVLQYASVVGEDFTSAVLAALLGVDELVLEEQLAGLAKGHHLIELHTEERLPAGPLTARYRFAHVLYQNVLYEGLIARRRRQLHGSVARELLAQYPDEPARITAQLALHFECAGDFTRAITYLMRAADNAARFRADREAKQHYTHAMSLVGELPRGEQVAQHIILLYNRGWLSFRPGDLENALADFNAMLELARSSELTDPEGAPALESLFRYFEQPWRDNFGLCDIPRIPDTNRSLGSSAFQGEALRSIGWALMGLSRFDAMPALVRELLVLAERTGNRHRRFEALGGLAHWHAESGNLTEAKRVLDEILPEANSLAHPRAAYVTFFLRANIHWLECEYERAEAVWEDARALTYEAFGLVTCCARIGLMRAHRGHVSRAFSALNEAHELATRLEETQVLQSLTGTFGLIYRELGDLERAITYDLEGLALARAHGLRGGEIRAWIGLASDYTSAGDRALAGQALGEIERLAGLESDRPWAARRGRFWRYFQAAKAEYLLLGGELELAEQQAAQLLASALEHDASAHVAIARSCIAGVRFGQGRFDAAEAELVAGLEAICDRPAPLVAWKLHAALGQARQRAGRASAAAPALARARELVQDLAARVDDARLRAVFLSSAKVLPLISNG